MSIHLILSGYIIFNGESRGGGGEGLVPHVSKCTRVSNGFTAKHQPEVGFSNINQRWDSQTVFKKL